MSNIYAINPIFRRGGETVHSPGADTYATKYECLGFFNDGTYIDFTQPGHVGLILGGHKVTFSANSSNAIPVLDQPYADPYIKIPGSTQSFKYALMVIAEGQNITPTTISDVTTRLNNPDAYNNIFKGDHRDPEYFSLFFGNGYMSCFPFVYEVVETGGTIRAQKLTTYSAVAPNAQLYGYNHTGGERITLDPDYYSYDWVLKYNGHGGIGTAISLSDWCTALNTKWTNYTDQLTGSNKMIGFLFFYRGYNGTTVTTRQLIKSFLDNCSTIDTTNDWTHERLT